MIQKQIVAVPYTNWLLRNAPEMISDAPDFLTRQHTQLGDILEINLPLGEKRISITNPEYIKHILVTNNKNYMKDHPTRVLKIALGNGLLTNEGDFWRRQRRIAQPAFHKRRIEALADTMIDHTEEMLQHWKTIKQPFDIAKEMMLLTSDIASRTLFGADLENLAEIGESIDRANKFLTERFRNPMPLPLWVPTRKHRIFNAAMKRFDSLMTDVLEQRRNANQNRNDLLALLMEARDEETGEGMTDRQLKDEILTLFAAGHETSANGLSWAFYLLARYPEVRQKLETEIADQLAGRRPTAGDLAGLDYTRRVIMESLRLYPPAWAIGRQALADDIIDGYRIPKGMQVLMSMYAVHHQESLWPNAETFDPDRFLPKNMAGQHKFSYFPFGGGPRLCIGNNFAMMEMQIVLVMAIQRFCLELLPGHPVERLHLITLKPRHGIMMNLSAR